MKQGASKPTSGMLTMSNVMRRGESLRFVIAADLIVSMPTGRVPKLSCSGESFKTGNSAAAAVGAAEQRTAQSSR